MKFRLLELVNPDQVQPKFNKRKKQILTILIKKYLTKTKKRIINKTFTKLAQ